MTFSNKAIQSVGCFDKTVTIRQTIRFDEVYWDILRIAAMMAVTCLALI
jgi:hypothetical protein